MADYEILQSVTLDFVRTDYPAIVPVKQYDNGVRVLEVKLVSGGVAYTIPDGFSVRISGTRPDKQGFYMDATSTNGNAATFAVTGAMTAAAGRTFCDVELSNADGEIVRSASLVLDVKPAAMQAETEEGSAEYQALDEALKLASASAASAKMAASTATEKSTAAIEAAEKAERATATATAQAGKATEAASAVEETVENAQATLTSLTTANERAEKNTDILNGIPIYDEDGTAYLLGIENGLLYYEEVTV